MGSGLIPKLFLQHFQTPKRTFLIIYILLTNVHQADAANTSSYFSKLSFGAWPILQSFIHIPSMSVLSMMFLWLGVDRVCMYKNRVKNDRFFFKFPLFFLANEEIQQKIERENSKYIVLCYFEFFHWISSFAR